jgi:hypothetical protein
VTGWFAGPSRRRRHWHAVGLAVVILVGGCSNLPGPQITLPAPPPGAAPQDATPVDEGLARILEHGGGERLQYRTAEGRSVSLALGPIYASARGAPCRLGRSDRIEPGVLAPTSYPFCRIDNRWYAMRPVVVSGY